MPSATTRSSVEELARRVYPGRNRVEKRHRVSVTRAAWNLSKRRPEIQAYTAEDVGARLVWFRHDEIASYTMARLKSASQYASNDPRMLPWHRKEEADLRATLADDRHRELIAPGGPWWRHVQMFLAQRDGDLERLAQMEAEQHADLQGLAANLRRLAPQ